jgi:antitoxin VapB
MALSIKDPETDRLARELAAATGESLTDAIRTALRERLARAARQRGDVLRTSIVRIQERVARLPVQDHRPADDLLGYDADGLPG